MRLNEEIKNLVAAMDAATNAIAARLDALKAQIAGGVTAEDAKEITDALTAEVAKLQALGASAENPVPAAALEPDQETTPILDGKDGQ